MTEYVRKLLIDNKDLIDQGNFEELYSRSRLGFRPELTTIFKHCNIDPFTDARKIFEYAYYEYEEDQIDVDSSVDCIDSNAFRSAHVDTINLPASVITINPRAFFNCKVSHVNFVDNSQQLRILDDAFSTCKNLETLNLPSNPKVISDFAFQNSGLRNFNLPQNLEFLGAYAFQKTGLLEIRIPKTIQLIGNAPFRDCYSLRKIYCPESLKTSTMFRNLISGLNEYTVIEWY